MLAPFLHSHFVEAGLDEAGRGCYAGPVFAAAVVLPKDFYHAFAVASVDNETIDKINILQASFTAMHLSIDQLKITPDFLLIDGNRFKVYPNIPHQCIVKGDGKYASIAAASILAKIYRDEFMQKLHVSFPHYGWDKNKGYGTASHRKAIDAFGLCSHHRKSFNIDPAGFIQK